MYVGSRNCKQYAVLSPPVFLFPLLSWQLAAHALEPNYFNYNLPWCLGSLLRVPSLLLALLRVCWFSLLTGKLCIPYAITTCITLSSSLLVLSTIQRNQLLSVLAYYSRPVILYLSCGHWFFYLISNQIIWLGFHVSPLSVEIFGENAFASLDSHTLILLSYYILAPEVHPFQVSTNMEAKPNLTC